MGTGINIGVIAVLAIIVFFSFRNRSFLDRDTDEVLDQYALRAESTDSLAAARENLSKIQDILYEARNSRASESEIQAIQQYESIAQSAVNDLVFEKWEEKVKPVLDRFAAYYYDVIESDPELFNFTDLDKSRRECLKFYDKFISLREPEVYLKVLPVNYLREYLGDNYDPCMQSRWRLEKKLNTAIDEAKPEKLRGERLSREIIDYVKNNQSVKRSDLKKHEFQGYTQEEVSLAYAHLLRKNNLSEYKIGRLYFVRLPEKQKMPAANTAAGAEKD